MDALSWSGDIKVIVRDEHNNVVDELDFKNLITSVGKNLIRDGLANPALDTEIKYMAIGDSPTTPSVNDTQLGNERQRKLVTSQNPGSTGQMITTVYLAPYDANFQIEEFGWFAGASATDTSGTGVLIARVLYSRLKTEAESIQVDRTDTFS